MYTKYMTDDQKQKVQQAALQGINHTSIRHLIDDNKKQQTVRVTKEGEPIEIVSEALPSPEVTLVETEPTIEDREVKKFVEVARDQPEIHPELKKAGLQSIDSSSLDQKHKVKLPIADEKVVEGLHKPISSSFRWLAEIAFFMLKQAHLTLKKIHGHVVRVMIQR